MDNTVDKMVKFALGITTVAFISTIAIIGTQRNEIKSLKLDMDKLKIQTDTIRSCKHNHGFDKYDYSLKATTRPNNDKVIM
jgi:hypothetical protein